MEVPTLDLSHPKVQAQVSSKASLREAHSKDASSGTSKPPSSTAGIPPGQRRSTKWIVLDLGVKPSAGLYDTHTWQLRVPSYGNGNKSQSWSVAELKELGTREYLVDWHCVTGWSTCQIGFIGVPLESVINACRPSPGWVCLLQTGADGYTVNVHREDAMHDDAFLALSMLDGTPISFEHGGPRIVLPHLFGWKSCKWLHQVEFLNDHQAGFWEKLGCHMRARVDLNERWAPKTKSIWDFLTGILSLYYYIFPEQAVVALMQKSAKVLGWFTLSGSPKKSLKKIP